ncbi:patatin-like phospholipase family protein [Alteromonas aestuariivivens]|uniref:Patatin-like phospholipase family protein n=1 Tax=Alteromonas aestuariivivens TaxID=1938339 RepID=A0A3D8MBB7_9ALTE|nr:patatin-like phospholipase family protein [Alteromonas aestuariivivens]RDV27548.1 patatin-like phospholipase family protein [Alteromonas aestuariivivens]
MAAPLDVYAGPDALALLREKGFYPLLFNYFLGASGGPKWFVLAGLDRVLFPEYFQSRGGQINIIGSSAGAFRAACMVQQDPLKAINRLAEHYSQTVYSNKPSAQEISRKGRQLIDYTLGDEGVMDILTNERFKAHFFVAKCSGLMQKESRMAQMSGLALSALANTFSRRALQRQYTRYVFSAPGAHLTIEDPYSIETRSVELGYNNVKDALLASGSIPIVLNGVEKIIAAPEGVYRDGGIIDYHFDLAFGPKPGLVLYPHFYPHPVPGWFDKGLKRRRPHASSYRNVVMLVPSAEFVASLPYGKIPDRKDFEKLDDQTRIRYWQKVLSETDRLGEYFMRITQDGSVMDKLRPLPFTCV